MGCSGRSGGCARKVVVSAAAQKRPSKAARSPPADALAVAAPADAAFSVKSALVIEGGGLPAPELLSVVEEGGASYVHLHMR
eukprot:8387831-Alexandrium_andersonii.AAC.1